MKQLNIGHFNTDSKKFTVTVTFFSRKKQKRLQKANIISLSISRNFRLFSDNSRLFQRFPKTTEDFWRLPKMSEDCYSPFEHRLKVHEQIFQEQIRIDNAKRL